MKRDSDVNPAYLAWKSSTGEQKEWLFLELLQKLEKFATAICWQRLPDHGDSIEGLVNEIVWNALHNEKRFKEKSRFSTWFYRIVVNACNSYLRAIKRKSEVPLEEDETIFPDLEARLDIAKQVASLRKEEQGLFRLMLAGHTASEIGKIMKISTNAVEHRLARLKEKLKNVQ